MLKMLENEEKVDYSAPVPSPADVPVAAEPKESDASTATPPPRTPTASPPFGQGTELVPPVLSIPSSPPSYVTPERREHSSDRDRGDRGDRGERSSDRDRDRGDRGDRGERSSDRDRGERSSDRDRGDRGDRDRGDRDRGDRGERGDRVGVPSPPDSRIFAVGQDPSTFPRKYQAPPAPAAAASARPRTSAHRLRDLVHDGSKTRRVDAEEEDRAKRELLFKMDILRTNRNSGLDPDQVPVMAMTTHTLDEMKFAYDQCLRRIHLQSSMGSYKQFLCIGFMVAEWLMVNLLRMDGEGFAQYQLESMHSYERLLLELGEKHTASIESKWPVEVRLCIMIAMNAAIFIGTRMFFKTGSANMLNSIMFLMNPGTATGTQPPSPQAPQSPSTPSPPPPTSSSSSSSEPTPTYDSASSATPAATTKKMRAPSLFDDLPVIA
jgi:hypothetical protein